MAQEFWLLARRISAGSVTSEQRRQRPKEPAGMIELFFRDALNPHRHRSHGERKAVTTETFQPRNTGDNRERKRFF
jgi:hypothetical protein